MRTYVESFRAEHGVHPTTAFRRRFSEMNGRRYRHAGWGWISEDTRLAIYERDGWRCGICGELVDREAHWNDDRAPSLDHITPKSQGGSNKPANLRCAHRLCNSLRGASGDVTSASMPA